MTQERVAAFLIHSLGETGERTKEFIDKEHFLASFRLRLKPAMEAAKAIGLEPKVFVLRSENPQDIDTLADTKPVIAIIGKLSHPEKTYHARIRIANLAAISILKNSDIPIIVDYSDHLVGGKEESHQFWKLILKVANLIVVPSKAMQAQLNTHTTQESRIIEDPLEGPKGATRNHGLNTSFNLKEDLNLLWFGHSTNLSYLVPWLVSLRQAKWPMKIYLRVLGQPGDLRKLTKWIKKQPKPESLWHHEFIIYKRQSDVFTALKPSHLVLVPSNPMDQRKCAASHNRVSESLNAGRLVLASKIASYAEILPEVMLVPKEISASEKLNLILERWGEINQWVKENQASLRERFNHESAVKAWSDSLKYALKESSK